VKRCPYRIPQSPLPPSSSVEAAKTHPRYRHLFEPGAQCMLVADHDGPHKRGSVAWHDPKVVYVGTRRTG